MADIWAGRYDVRTPLTATGTGALAVTIDYNKAFALEEIRIHVGVAAASAESLTITVDAVAGAAYDTLIKTIPMAGVTSYVWVPEKTCLCVAGDKLVMAWANSDGRTWGLTYIYRRVN